MPAIGTRKKFAAILSDLVESGFWRSVEDLVSTERVQTLRLVLWEHRFHLLNAPPNNDFSEQIATTGRSRDRAPMRFSQRAP